VKKNIFSDGKLLAVSTVGSGYEYFQWKHYDPAVTVGGDSGLVGEALWFAFDPAGADVGFENPYEDPNPPEPPPPFHGEFAHPEGVEMVEVDGVLTPLNLFPGMAAILSQCPDRGC